MLGGLAAGAVAGTALGAAASAGGSRVGNVVARRLVDDTQAGKEAGKLSPEEVAKLEKSFNPKAGLRVIDVPNTTLSRYDPLDHVEIDQLGRKTSTLRGWAAEYAAKADQDFAKEIAAKGIREGTPEYKAALDKATTKVMRLIKAHATPGVVVADRSAYTYAHELGHATGIMSGLSSDNKAIRGLSKAYTGVERLGRKLNRKPWLGGVAAARQAYKEQTGEENRGLQAADYAGRALTGVHLFEEGQASARALAKLHGVQGWKGVGGGLKRLGPAYMTYLAAPVASHVLAPLAVKAGYAAKRKATGEDQEQPRGG